MILEMTNQAISKLRLRKFRALRTQPKLREIEAKREIRYVTS